MPWSGAVVFCLLAAVAGSAAAQEVEGWKLAFSEDFERSLPGPDWKVLEGGWRIEGGWLNGKGQLLCTWRFDGPQRLEYDARTAERSAVGDHAAGDLSAFLASNEAGYKQGYFFGFGSEGNQRSKMLANGEEIAGYDKVITPFKTHHVVCEWDGERLTHVIDGAVAHTETPEARLLGPPHRSVGFYLWEAGSIDNVRIYTRTGAAEPPKKRQARVGARPDTALVPNGSFEKLQPGGRPRAPGNWIVQKWSRRDTAKLITDPVQAHRGRRCMRLFAPGKHGVRIHSVQDRGTLQMEPGRTYRIRVWARADPATPATLIVEPGGGRFELGPTWRKYELRYEHGRGERPEMGMLVAVRGGAAYVDDVSIVLDGEDEPVSPRAKTEWTALKTVPIDEAWALPSFRERIPVELSEMMGEEAESYCVSLPLVGVFRSLRYDFLRPGKVQVVDASPGGGKVVPSAIVAADRNPQVSAGDLLVFPADCPPHATTTYHVYLKDRAVEAGDFAPTDQLPDAVNLASDYPHDLDVEALDAESRARVAARRAGGKLVAELWGWTARSVEAALISPDGARRIPLPLEAVKPGHWAAAPGFAFPADAEDGVWALEGNFEHESGESVRVVTAFAVGNGLWAGTNAERIYEDDPPRFGADRARIAAARNEWEAFQVALTSERGLEGVTLQAGDLERKDGKARIDANRIVIECVEQADVIGALRNGPTPDPLVPWETEEVMAGRQRVAWVTVRVPPDAPAGTYAGELVAASAGNDELRLPIELEVFDFSLPDKLHFTPVLGADISPFITGEEKRSQEDSYGEYWKGYSRYLPTFEMPHRQTVMDIARLFGERHITPFYYSQAQCPYATPWSYDTETATLSMDFALMDEALALFGDLDIKYLFLGSEYRVRLVNGGAIYFSTFDGDTRYGWHGTERGREMFTAWLKANHEHLRETGWSDRTLLYTNDESWGKRTADGRESNAITTEYSRLVRETAPGFGTFVADNAGGNWLPPLAHTDHFTGIMSKGNRERFEKQGGVHWGLYNRPSHLGNPVGVSRIIGLDSAFRGWSHYFFWDVTDWKQDPWINPRYYIRAGTKNDFFVSGASRDGYAILVYPWPHWRSAWKPGRPTVCSSIRLEALRESAEDYEYLKMLSDKSESLPAGSDRKRACSELLERARKLVAESNLGDDYKYGGSWSIFIVDSEALLDLHRNMGRVLGGLSADARRE